MAQGYGLSLIAGDGIQPVTGKIQWTGFGVAVI
jgi:hypothetical protein